MKVTVGATVQLSASLIITVTSGRGIVKFVTEIGAGLLPVGGILSFTVII
jgi:hypothetical protein